MIVPIETKLEVKPEDLSSEPSSASDDVPATVTLKRSNTVKSFKEEQRHVIQFDIVKVQDRLTITHNDKEYYTVHLPNKLKGEWHIDFMMPSTDLKLMTVRKPALSWEFLVSDHQFDFRTQLSKKHSFYWPDGGKYGWVKADYGFQLNSFDTGDCYAIFEQCQDERIPRKVTIAQHAEDQVNLILATATALYLWENHRSKRFFFSK
ncbi:hypothetical protein EDD86DRAFT_80931 [Gorgonomyces haynaldii]|nr:hypothetical protein EDD86DRAFT_80931 [Gorgonomyces haynaldii]